MSNNTFFTLRKSLQEKTLTPAEKKKREEVAQAIERENPDMPMGMKMAIATKTAKRVAEAADYSVDVIHHHMGEDGKKVKKTYNYVVKNALTSKHAKHIAMQKHEKAVKLGKGEMYHSDSSNVKMMEEVELEEGEHIVTPKKMHGEPPKGTYAYERKYGKYTSLGHLRKKPNPNKPPEEVKEEVKTTHNDPLVTVHKNGELYTHANLSVANHIHGTKVKAADVHKGAVKTGNYTFAISMHHAKEVGK